MNKSDFDNNLDSDNETVRPGTFHRSTPGKNRNKKNINERLNHIDAVITMYICFVVDFTRQCFTCVWESHGETEHKPIDHNHNIM